MVALWLVPNSQDAETLKTIMSPWHDTKNLLSSSSYPVFEPHVTLARIPSRDLADIRAALPRRTQASAPIFMRFASLDIGDHYFRSVYLSVEPTPELSALHKDFHEKIEVPHKTPSFPHCSVCYIGDEDADKGEKERFVEELRAAGRVKSENGAVSLRCGEGEGEVWMSEWRAREIWVVQCEGPVAEWTVSDKITL